MKLVHCRWFAAAVWQYHQLPPEFNNTIRDESAKAFVVYVRIIAGSGTLAISLRLAVVIGLSQKLQG